MAKSVIKKEQSFIDKLEELWLKKKYYYGINYYQGGRKSFAIGIDSRNYSIKYKKKPPTDPDYIRYVEEIKEMMVQARGNKVVRKYDYYQFNIFTEYGGDPLADITALEPTVDDMVSLYKNLFFGNLNVLETLMHRFSKELSLLFFIQGYDYFHDNEYEEKESNASLINFLSILLQHDCTPQEILDVLPQHLENSRGFNPEINKDRFKEHILTTLNNDDLYKKVIVLIYGEDQTIKNLYNDIAYSLHLELNTEPVMAQYGFTSVNQIISGLVTMNQYCNEKDVLAKINHTVDNNLHFGYYFNAQENTHNIIIKAQKEIDVKQIKHLLYLFLTFYEKYKSKISGNLNMIDNVKISDELRKSFDRIILNFSLEHTLPENEEDMSATTGKI